MHGYEPTPAEFEEWEHQEKAEREAYQQHKAAEAAWAEKWPNHCTNCGGWGGFSTPASYDGPGDFDPCEPGEDVPIEKCHRCGELGLDEDGNGPCKKCGWNYDDGIPQW